MNGSSLDIDISHLKKGVYQLIIRTEGKIRQAKIIKQ